MRSLRELRGFWLLFFITLGNAGILFIPIHYGVSFDLLLWVAAMCWFGYDQGVFSGVLISEDFINHFPQVKSANIKGIVSSCFSVGSLLPTISSLYCQPDPEIA